MGKTIKSGIFKGNLCQKLSILKQIASGMSHLHANGIIHRDLKTDNILMNDQYIPKITDFGVSKLKEDLTRRIGTQFDNTTPQYLAPEITLSKVLIHSFDLIHLSFFFTQEFFFNSHMMRNVTHFLLE